MSDIQIVCDSMVDVPKEIIEKYNIVVVPLTILIDGQEFLDGVDLTPEQFYEAMRTKNELPKTSQATYIRFKEVFDRFAAEGKEILYIGGSSVMSGTIQSATLAKSDTDAIIHIFDSGSVTLGSGQYVFHAARMLKQGMDIQTVLNELQKLKEQSFTLFSVHNLDYLQKSGRVSAAKALIGNVLSIKPIFTIREGLVTLVTQTRGKKRTMAKIIDDAIEHYGGDLSNKTVMLGYGDNPDEIELLKSMLLEKTSVKELYVSHIGASVCAHTGPHIVGIACA